MPNPQDLSPGILQDYIGPTNYNKPEQFKTADRIEENEPNYISVNTPEFGVLMLIKPGPVGFNTSEERFKDSKQKPPG